MSTGTDLIAIEVAAAWPDRQRIVTLEVPAGTTARQAVALSELADEFPGLDPASDALGIFGQVVADNRELKAGDRVEIYRQLTMDPMEARRKRAENT